MRSTGPILAIALLCAAAAAPATAAEKKRSPRPAMVRISDERERTVWAYVDRRVRVRSRPSAKARVIGRIAAATFYGRPEVVLALGHSKVRGGLWTYVRYPGIGRQTGWVPSSAISKQRPVATRLIIDRSRLQARLYRRGKRIFKARVGVGASQSPTPKGRSYIRERLVPADRDGLYGVLAFGLSAHSKYRTDWPGGGQVGVHGTNQPELIPGRISNGCVRLSNRDIRRLGRLMPVGTPVLLR
jgi:lipoprotein-anchoring transpeptidase ErfK/SrfK